MNLNLIPSGGNSMCFSHSQNSAHCSGLDQALKSRAGWQDDEAL